MKKYAQAGSKSSFTLSTWRENLIKNVLRGACILTIPALAIGGYAMAEQGLILQLVINIVLVALLLVITFSPVPYTIRTGIALFLLYLISMNTLIEVGIHGDTRLYFFFLVLMTAMLFGLRAAVAALAATLASVGIYAFLLFSGYISLTNPIAVSYPVSTWISDIMIFLTLIGTSMAGIATLLREFAYSRVRVEESLLTLEEEQNLLEQRVAERTFELEVLHQTSLDISGKLDRRDLQRNIVERGCALLRTSTGGIYLSNEKSSRLELVFAIGFSREETPFQASPDSSIITKVFSSGEPVSVEKPAMNAPGAEPPGRTVSLLAVPLRYGNEMIGVLAYVKNEGGRSFTENDVWLATLFANQASIAINNASLYERAQNEIAERIQVETALEKSQEQHRHDSLHDALTGLPNKDLLLARISHAMARAKRKEDFIYAVIFIDIDRFKVINDSLGYLIGDKLLMAIARRLETCVRAVDLVARFGGDEFVVYLEDIKEHQDVTDVADRLLCELKMPFILDERHIHVTASMGIVLSTLGYEQPEDILRDSDIALYRAKGLGKAKYQIFETSLRGQAMARLDMENDLHKAIENDALFLNYQPIVSLETGNPIGVEALARWKHPARGIVAPVDFIPVAEETGLIIPIGRWVLTEACRRMRAWQKEYPLVPQLSISVNLSPRQFAQPDLAEQLANIVKTSDLDPRSLHLEITESTLMQDIEFTLGALTKLHDIGIRIELDDFGTDYSSLYYLQQIPVDTIKIDRSFVSKMNTDNKNAGIVRAIITLAKELGMNTVAEGIETKEQLDFLSSLKCGYGQGYYISRPLDEQSVGSYLEKFQVTDRA